MLAAPFAAFIVLSELTLREIGLKPVPHGPHLRDDVALRYWREHRETTFEVEPLFPWSPLISLMNGRTTPGASVADAVASRFLAHRSMSTGQRLLQRTVLKVWLTRHWSAAELTRTDAVMTSFGLDPNAMSEVEIEALMRRRRCPGCKAKRVSP